MSHPAFLRDKRSGEVLAAQLLEEITEAHLQSVENDWMPIVMKRIRELIDQGQPPQNWPQSFHWNWRNKTAQRAGLLACQNFAIECDGQLQGLMQVNTAKSLCRIPEQAGKHLVYIDFIETAPWNSLLMVQDPQFGGVGLNMLMAAIEYSQEFGFHGRIGLHSLPQSEQFYSDVGMTDLGLDASYQNLRYFEMTAAQAAALSF